MKWVATFEEPKVPKGKPRLTMSYHIDADYKGLAINRATALGRIECPGWRLATVKEVPA